MTFREHEAPEKISELLNHLKRIISIYGDMPIRYEHSKDANGETKTTHGCICVSTTEENKSLFYITTVL